MPGNDFEKQVQKKMEELQFTPSDTVWPAVEKQIAGRKKRRGLFFLLPFLLLLLGGAAWMYMPGIDGKSAKKQLTDTAASSATNKNKSADKIAISSASNDNEKKKKAVLSKDNTSGVSANEKTMAVAKEEKVARKNIPALVKNTDNTKRSLNATYTNKNGRYPDKMIAGKSNASKRNDQIKANEANDANLIAKHYNKKHTTGIIKNAAPGDAGANETQQQKAIAKRNTAKKITDKDDELIESTASQKESNIKQVVPVEGSIVDNTITKDSVAASNSLAVSKTNAADSLKTKNKADSVAVVASSKKTKKAKNNIEWGLNLGAGTSSVSDGIGSVFSGSTPYYDAASFSVAPGNPNNNPTNINNGGTPQSAKPSDAKKGFSYSAGVFISKPLKNNFTLVAGLNYNYYSTSIEVGAKIDTGTALRQYRTGDKTKYINQFHFIELPVVVKKQFGNRSRFSANGGLVFSVLAGSNVLQYDSQKSIYTADNSHINKLQLGLLAGLSYRLFPKTLPVEIGPQFNYGLSNIFAKELYSSKHLFFAGINAKIFLHKSKQ